MSLMDHLQGISGEMITYEGGFNPGSYRMPHPSSSSSAHETALAVAALCLSCGLSVLDEPPYAHIRELGSVPDRLMGHPVTLPAGDHLLIEVAQMLEASWSTDYPQHRIHVGSGARAATRVRVPPQALPARELLQQLEVLGPSLEPTRVVWKTLETDGGVGVFLKVTHTERRIAAVPVAEQLQGLEAKIADLERDLQRSGDPGAQELLEGSLAQARERRAELLRDCPQAATP